MKNLIKNNLKQKIWLTGCVTLLFILMRPMMQLMAYENEKRFAFSQESLIKIMENFFLPDVFTDYVPTAIVCVVIAIVFFGYLFSKKQVDLFHSIPVNRKTLFITNYLSGVFVYLTALIIEYVLCVFIAIPNHYMTGNSWRNLVAALCINFVHFLFGYGVAICGIMLAGNAIVALAGSAVIALVFPIIATLLEYFERYFYVTYGGHSYVRPELIMKYYWLSPITSYATIIQRTKYEWDQYYYTDVKMTYAGLILPVLMLVLFTIAGYFLYLKRPSEAAGKAIAFKKSRPYIEIPIVVIGGLLGAWFMSTSVNTYKTTWIWTGAIIGVLLVHFILEAIMNESFKAILSHKVQLLASLAAALLIIGIFYGDFTKYDTYVPDRDKVVSAGIYFSDIDNNVSLMECMEDPVNKGYFINKYVDAIDNAYVNRFEDKVLIDKIFAISNIGVSCVQEMIDDKYNNPEDMYYGYKETAYEESVFINDVNLNNNVSDLSDDEAYKLACQWMEENGISVIEHNDVRKINVKVCYELKNGRIILRQYDIPLSKVLSGINEIYKTKEYKDVHFNLGSLVDNGVIYKVEVYDGYENRVVSLTENAKNTLLNTYLEELNKMDINTISTVPIGRIAPLIKVSDVYDENVGGYYLYPQFTKTLSLMEEYGVDMSGFTSEIKADELLSVNINSYNLYGYSKDNTLYLDNLVYDIENDSEYLKEIAPMLVNANNVWSNQLLISNNTNYDTLGIDITVNLTPMRGIQRFFTVMLKDGTIPEKIQKDIAIRLWEDNNY